MIQSMTGFGRCQKTLGSRDITVEIKAVNHRYLEFSSRLPRSLGFIEDRLKAQVQSRIARGKVEVSVTVAEQKGSASRVTLNEGLALSYLEELRVFARKNGLTDDLALSDLCRIPELFTTRTAEVDEEALWRDISETADGALDSFIAMRRREGEKLSADLAAKLYNILTLVEAVERRSPETVEAYRQRLYKKLGELLEDRQIDDSRVLTEAALFADRVAVDDCPAAQPHRSVPAYPHSGGAGGPKAGFPGAGDEPGNQHHRLQGTGCGNGPHRCGTQE